jgi:acetyl esterase/lipase
LTTHCAPVPPTPNRAPTLAPSLTPPIVIPPIAKPAPTNSQDKFGTIERDVTYCTITDVALKLDLYYPTISAREPLPVVVNIHGGSWSAGDKSKSDSAADIPTLVAHGYLVAVVNYRLAPQWKFPAQIQDVKCAIRFLRANAIKLALDPKRIGVMGCSAGGHLAALAGVADQSAGFDDVGEYANESSRVQAVAALSAPTDLTLYDAVARADMLKRVFGVTTALNPVLVHASPVTYVSPDDPPMLIVQANQDRLVSSKHGEELEQRLTKVGVPAKLIAVKNATHCFPAAPAMSPTREQISQLIADFFDQYLQ